MTNIEKMEFRFKNMNFESNDNEMKVSGYVNKTNQWSETLGQRSKFVERIVPGTFDRALRNGNEVHFYAEHDPKQILASTRNGSLVLREDEKGLYMEATIEPTSWGKDYYTLIKRGIIQNMSFGMKVLKDAWQKRNDGVNERTISDLYLAEVSAVRNPAYAQSTIAARSIEIVEDVVPEETQEPKQTEPKTEERELTPAEQLAKKKIELNSYRKTAELFGSTDEDIQKIKFVEGEVRQLETLLENQTAPTVKEQSEQRAVTTGTMGGLNTTTGYSTVPLLEQTIIADKIIEIAEQKSAVAQMVYYVKTKGQAQYVIDTAMSPATIYPEYPAAGSTVSSVDPNFKSLTLKQKRFASAVEVSQILLEDSAVDLNEHLTEVLSFRLLNGIEKQMFNTGDSDGANAMQNIFSHNSGTTKVEDIEVITAANSGTVNTYDDFAKAIAGLSKQPQMMLGAVWAIADPEMIATIKDPYGFSILNFKASQENPGSIGTILGIPAYVIAEGFSDAQASAVLINPPRSYCVSLANDATFKIVAGDTTQELRRAKVYLGEVYADGRILNPRGIKIIKHA